MVSGIEFSQDKWGHRLHSISFLYRHINKALDALRRMRAGIRADITGKKHTKEEVSSLFRPKKVLKLEKKPAWKHKFFCLAFKDQSRVPTSDVDKEELYLANLGEKEIEFQSLDASADEFKEVLLKAFPRLQQGGGYQLLKCLPNSRRLEVLSSVVYASPGALKQRVGIACLLLISHLKTIV